MNFNDAAVLAGDNLRRLNIPESANDPLDLVLRNYAVPTL
jgi:hypothetical protein